MLELIRRGVAIYLVGPRFYMYRLLKVRLKIQGSIIPVDIPMYIGIYQSAITSPMVYNNVTLPAQNSIPISCVVKATNTSVLCYADDLLNLIRSVSSLEESFNGILSEFRKIGLNLNAGKSQVLLFDCPSELASTSVNLGGAFVAPSQELIYLGLPIGDSTSSTRKLLVVTSEKKIWTAYASLVLSQTDMTKKLSAKKMYNVVVLPQVLYLVPFTVILNESDKKQIRKLFFRYAKFLLRVPICPVTPY